MINTLNIKKWFKVESEYGHTWIVTLFTRPNLYLFNLVKRTILMGLFLVVFYFLFKKLGLKEQSIPSTLHSIVGIVIGLLLVFRTNTAYDRWWEARKIFASLQSSFLFIRTKLLDQKIAKEYLLKLNNNIFDYVSIKDVEESSKIKKQFIENYSQLSDWLHRGYCSEQFYGNLDKKLSDVLEHFSSLERIKDTPIPISYSLHIKLSVFAYLLTLPLGLFFGLGVWSIPIVMILYFIIAGIDIISSEIENPFRGDPNDLPIDDFKKENEKYING